MKRRIWVATAALVILAATAVASRAWWLPLPGEWLEVSGPVEPGDVIFVFSGHSLWRAKTAARLYGEKYAPHIVVTGGADSELLRLVTGERATEAHITSRILVALGVPREALTLVDGVTSTHADAAAFAAYARSHEVRSAIVVTSHLHSRRARWMLQRALDDDAVRLQVVEAEQPDFAAERWWRQEDGLVTVFNEYLKFGYYLIHY